MIEVSEIKSRLDEYLEFDSDQLFLNKNNLIRIFGGAIRDSISNQEIHDVDIICGSKASEYIQSVLKNNGYYFLSMLNGKDLQEMYSDIHVINEPHTWVKNNKIVQLIKPSILGHINPMPSNENLHEAYRDSFYRLISNVDLSCCGVSYDGELHEDYKNAILHCYNKVFSINYDALMYNRKRCLSRVHKMIDRGWKEIENTVSNNRDLKINNIIEISV